MKKISGSTLWVKVILPPIVYGALLIANFAHGIPGLWGCLYLLALLALVTYTFKKVWRLCDEVHDYGTYLIFRRGKKHQRVTFDEIRSMSTWGTGDKSKVVKQPTSITWVKTFRDTIILHTNQTGPIGADLRFFTPTTLDGSAAAVVEKSLSERIEAAHANT